MSEEKNIPDKNYLPDRQAGKNRPDSHRDTNSKQENVDQQQNIQKNSGHKNLPAARQCSELKKGENSQHFPEDSHVPKPATENMETHAHHLHKAPSHGWKHYLFEFLMLFLAVFCGFIAENQREHYVDRKKETIYIKGLLNDLITDTSNFSQFITKTTQNELRIDSLINLLKEYRPPGSTAELYYLARTLFGKIERLQYNKRTYDQLKSSGSLRLIHRRKVLDSISKYFESLQWIDLQNQLQIERQHYMEQKSVKFLMRGPLIQYLTPTFKNLYRHRPL